MNRKSYDRARTLSALPHHGDEVAAGRVAAVGEGAIDRGAERQAIAGCEQWVASPSRKVRVPSSIQIIWRRKA